MVLNKWERKLYKFRAKIYMRLPKHSRLLKLQIALFVLFSLMLGQKLFGFGLESEPDGKMGSVDVWAEQTGGDEPVTGEDASEQNGIGNGEAALVIEYATGSGSLLEKEQIQIRLPDGEDLEESAPTPAAEGTKQPGEGSASEVEDTVHAMTGTYQSVFLPESYPVLSDIIGNRYLKENLLQLEYLKENFYIVNATTKMTEKEFDAEYFLSRDLSIEKKEEPQILIYHTHASEGFIDSRPGMAEDTVVGAGEELARILQEKYGYHVLHDTTVFDRKNGKDNRNYAYSDALEYMEELLAEYPSIEVIIDLHRDAGTKRVVTIQGRQVAKVMLFNGLCRNTQGELTYLPNKNLLDNLAFSFQMKLFGDEMYPGFMNRIFLKDYRYNMHLAERYLLIELGTEKNTVEEAKNAMEPLADVLHQVLSGD